MDIGHLKTHDLTEFFKQKKCSFLVFVYMTCLVLHLSSTPYDEKLSLLAYKNHTDLEGRGNNTKMDSENDIFDEQMVSTLSSHSISQSLLS